MDALNQLTLVGNRRTLFLPCTNGQANLAAFKEGDVRFLICTDVAARGVDIKGLPYVVNMTLPDVPENYIHRIGRVGRQDCLGLAVSIVACDGCKEKVSVLHGCSYLLRPSIRSCMM